MDDLARRTQINKLLTHLGGTYVKNLERPVKVTHLLCSGDEETDKMRYAEKFNKRGEAQIWLVWEEWFWDSIEFGGRFGEEKYAVGRPRPERKVISDCRWLVFIYLFIGNLLLNWTPVPASAPPPPPLPLRSVLQQVPSAEAMNQDPNPQLPSNGPDEETEVASVKRVPAVTLQLWETLLKPRGFKIDGGKLVRSPTKSQAGAGADEGQMLPLAPKTKGKGKDSKLLFSGLKFKALGEAKCQNVKTEIEGCGGQMISEAEEADEHVDFVVVRLVRYAMNFPFLFPDFYKIDDHS